MAQIDKIKAFIGSEGMAVLEKALKTTGKSENMSIYAETLQILPRAVLSWAFNVAKNITANTQNYAIPDTEYTLTIKKNQDNKIDFEILKKTETVVAHSSVELPALVLNLFDISDCLDAVQKSFNDNMEDFQKAIDFLVSKYHFERKIVVTLNKSEHYAKCPDCGGGITLDGEHKKLCICFKILKNHVHVKKNENGSVDVSFSDKWNKQNVYMLMKVLKANLK